MSLTTESLNGIIANGNRAAGAYGALPPRYPGEDTRPTSSKELAGWYAYAFAAEVYVICGASLFRITLGTPFIIFIFIFRI